MTIRIFKKLMMIISCLMIIAVAGCSSGMQTHPAVDYSDFAKCLTDSGMKMFGAAWCGHCNNVKERFGDAFRYIDYQECDPSFGGDQKACQDAGVHAYPAFAFGDEPLRFGEIEFGLMAEKTGCDLP